MKRKSNRKIWKALEQKIPDYLIQAGWFEESKYKDGTPIGGIAAVQNYGAVINQNVTDKQRAFLHYLGIHLKKTTSNLNIVIPPTHFWENCQKENKEKWKKLIKDAWSSVFLGNITPEKAVEQVGMAIEGDIAKSMRNGDFPPVKPSTLKAKLMQYADKETEGNLRNRLRTKEDLMISSISHKVTEL